jgi:ribosomal protein S14
MRTFLAVVVAVIPTGAVLASDKPAKSPSGMTSAEVREHNKSLASNAPSYIRCRKAGETGSLVRQMRVCRTNADWGATFRTGNQNARDSIDAMNRGGTSDSN